MAESSYGNAMTEIALALAMAFFSIMVLTMVSMSAAPSTATGAGTPAAMKLARNNAATEKSVKPAKKPKLVIFWQGAFLNRDLTPFTPGNEIGRGRIILALSPNLPMNEALAARARFGAGNVVVSTLDERWLARLRTAHNKETSR